MIALPARLIAANAHFTSDALVAIAKQLSPEFLLSASEEEFADELELWSFTGDIVEMASEMEYEFTYCPESNEIEDSDREILEFVREHREIYPTATGWIYRNE